MGVLVLKEWLLLAGPSPHIPFSLRPMHSMQVFIPLLVALLPPRLVTTSYPAFYLLPSFKEELLLSVPTAFLLAYFEILGNVCSGKGSTHNSGSRCEHWAPARLCKYVSGPWSGLCTLCNTWVDLCQPLHRPPSWLRLHGGLGAASPEDRAGREEQMEMRALLMACLTIVLCVDVVNSLMCYTCTNQTSNDQCLMTSTCTQNETACVTVVEKIGSGTHQQKLISKNCISNCGIFQDSYECCSQDNCNRNEASGMRPPIAVLGTAVLVGVTRPLLWTGL